MKSIFKIFKICSLLFFFQSYSQTVTNQEKIKNYIETYFNADREIIHVQFNKNTYTNNEDLAFKGYVWSKINSAPHAYTTNVELLVYNEKEEIVLHQLLFTSKGTFAGGIHLNDKFKTGKYFFHFYTNWMNNFVEDDSFTQIIEIIDKKEPFALKSTEPNWKSAMVTLHPEGGSIINETSNTIGVAIKDCNNRGIQTEGIIIDSKSNEIASFQTNKIGNAIFYLIPKMNETYTLKTKSDKFTLSQVLPKIQETGIIVTYNNNLPNNRLLIGIKTNEKGLKTYQNKKFTLVIQQDERFVQKEITFNDKTEQTLIVDKTKLSNGVNSLRLIDEDLNEITERLVYIYPTNNTNTTFKVKNTVNDSIALSGRTKINQANLSISVLPDNTICMNQKRSIIGTFYLNAYLENPEIDNYDYYAPENKDKKQEMELLMLNQNKSKFHWDNIKSNPPKLTNTFDKGITIRGTVEKEMNANSKYTMSVISFKGGVFEKAPVDKDRHFILDHFFAQDSTVFVLQMMNEKNVIIPTKIQASVLPNQNMFPLPMHIYKSNCPIDEKADKTFTFKNLPPESNSIKLNDVIIKTHEILKHKSSMSPMASAFKFGDKDFERVLDFLGRNGYRTGMDPGNGDVYIRSTRDNFLGDSAGPPAVYIDNNQLWDLNFLFSLTLQDVDEIYIDKTGSSDTGINNNGTIKIFLKDLSKFNTSKTKLASLIITKGFTANIKFKNTQFDTPEEFTYFGTLNWTPNIATKEDLSFEVKLPKSDQKEFQVYLEGFSEDGQLISEVKKVSLSNTSDTANNVKSGQ